MDVEEEQQAGVNWPFLGTAVGTVAVAGGAAFGVANLAGGTVASFGALAFLDLVLGILMVFGYVTVLSSTGPVNPGTGAGHLGGIPETGGYEGSDDTFEGWGLSRSHLVLFAGIGFLVAGVVGVALAL
ncbi:hypothetical protein BRD00_10225 [Halobacteriales archaeon QS_8_69_26]|nr:MAG: hypothetical protein BRD00_10225 [Halobacteriales archaeon QS_8_69_26]